MIDNQSIAFQDKQDMMGHCWKSKNDLMSDVLLWIPTHGHACVGQPA